MKYLLHIVWICKVTVKFYSVLLDSGVCGHGVDSSNGRLSEALSESGGESLLFLLVSHDFLLHLDSVEPLDWQESLNNESVDKGEHS
jgi:hypothetical protein